MDACRRWLLTLPTANRQMARHGHHVSCEGTTDFASLVDQDGDGLLSFGEYMFFLTLLASACAVGGGGGGGVP